MKGTKLLLAILLVFPVASAQTTSGDSPVEYRYDRFEQRTHANLRLSLATSKQTDRLHLILTSSYGQDGPLWPVKLTFLLWSNRPFPPESELHVLVDEVPLLLSNAERQASLSTVVVDGRVLQRSASLEIDSFAILTMANGKKVEGRLGSTEFQLTTSQLTRLKEFSKPTAEFYAKLKKQFQEVERRAGELEAEATQLNDLASLTRTDHHLAQLETQLASLQAKQSDLQARRDEIEFRLRPENVKRQPKDIREEYVRRLQSEKSSIDGELKTYAAQEISLKEKVAQVEKELDKKRESLRSRQNKP